MAKSREAMKIFVGKKPIKPAKKRPPAEKPRKKRFPVFPPKEYPAFEPPEPWPEPKPSKPSKTDKF